MKPYYFEILLQAKLLIYWDKSKCTNTFFTPSLTFTPRTNLKSKLRSQAVEQQYEQNVTQCMDQNTILIRIESFYIQKQ